MKLAEEIAEEHYRLPRAIHDLNHPMAKGMLENIVAAKLEPVKDMFKELVRVAGELSHYPTYGIDIGAHPVNDSVKSAKYRLGEISQRVEETLAIFEEDS